MTMIWVGWILTIIISFAVFETYALKTGRTTLSRFTYNCSQSWPLLPFLLGLIVGGVAVHFWWHWCPDLGLGVG